MAAAVVLALVRRRLATGARQNPLPISHFHAVFPCAGAAPELAAKRDAAARAREITGPADDERVLPQLLRSRAVGCAKREGALQGHLAEADSRRVTGDRGRRVAAGLLRHEVQLDLGLRQI